MLTIDRWNFSQHNNSYMEPGALRPMWTYYPKTESLGWHYQSVTVVIQISGNTLQSALSSSRHCTNQEQGQTMEVDLTSKCRLYTLLCDESVNNIRMSWPKLVYSYLFSTKRKLNCTEAPTILRTRTHRPRSAVCVRDVAHSAGTRGRNTHHAGNTSQPTLAQFTDLFKFPYSRAK